MGGNGVGGNGVERVGLRWARMVWVHGNGVERVGWKWCRENMR